MLVVQDIVEYTFSKAPPTECLLEPPRDTGHFQQQQHIQIQTTHNELKPRVPLACHVSEDNSITL